MLVLNKEKIILCPRNMLPANSMVNDALKSQHFLMLTLIQLLNQKLIVSLLQLIIKIILWIENQNSRY